MEDGRPIPFYYGIREGRSNVKGLVQQERQAPGAYGGAGSDV